MPTVAQLEAVVTVRDNATPALKDVDRQLDRLKHNTEKNLRGATDAFHKFGNEIRPVLLGIGVGIAGALGFSIKKAMDFDSLKRGLTAVAGSAQIAEAQLVRLKEIAKQPGLGFEEAIQGSIRLQAAGLSAQLAEKSLREFGNAIAIVGGGKAELDGVALALSQIASKGKVTAEEINQIAERVPQIRVAMKEAFGTASTEEIQKMGITAEKFIDKITDALGKIPRASGGVKNSIENMKDSINATAVNIGNSLLPTVQKMVEWLERATKWFTSLTPATQDFIVKAAALTLGLGLLAVAIAKVVAILASAKAALIAYSLASGGAAKATAGFTLALHGMKAALVPLIPIILAAANAYLLLEAARARADSRVKSAQLATGEVETRGLAYINLELKTAAGNLGKLKALAKDWSTNMPGRAGQVALEGLRTELEKIGYTLDANNNVIKFTPELIKAADVAVKGLSSSLAGTVPKIEAINEAAKTLADTIREVMGGQALDRESAGILRGLGLTTDLDLAQSKLAAIEGAIRSLVEAATAEGRLYEAMPQINALLNDRAHALIQVAAAERVLADAEKQREGMIERAKQIALAVAEATLKFTGFTMAVHESQIAVGKFNEQMRQTVKVLSDAAMSEAEQTFTDISEKMKELRMQAEDWAWAFSDAFIDGLRRVREEGFAGLLRSFEEMLLDMALAFIRSQLVNLMTSFFGNLLGGLGGGGGGGGLGDGSSGGLGQTMTGGLGTLQMAPAGGVNITMNIMTPDVNSFRNSQDQLVSDAYTAGISAKWRNG